MFPLGGGGSGSIVMTMAYAAKKSEHAGPKRGRGGFWGSRQDAKVQSNRERRRNDREEAGGGLDDNMMTNTSVKPAR